MLYCQGQENVQPARLKFWALKSSAACDRRFLLSCCLWPEIVAVFVKMEWQEQFVSVSQETWRENHPLLNQPHFWQDLPGDCDMDQLEDPLENLLLSLTNIKEEVSMARRKVAEVKREVAFNADWQEFFPGNDGDILADTEPDQEKDIQADIQVVHDDQMDSGSRYLTILQPPPAYNENMHVNTEDGYMNSEPNSIV